MAYDWEVLVCLGNGVLEGVFGMCWSDLGIGINLAHGDSGGRMLASLSYSNGCCLGGSPHGVCYSFQAMRSCESPRYPFNINFHFLISRASMDHHI